MKKCYLCQQGNIEKKIVTVEREWEGKKIIIENVPAEVCDQCGEKYFDPDTTLKLEKIKKHSRIQLFLKSAHHISVIVLSV